MKYFRRTKNEINGTKLKIKIQVIKGMTSRIEIICFAFGTKNETVGTENESVGTENYFFLGQKNNLGWDK